MMHERMRQSLHRQHGAVGLIAAVFLILVVLIMGQVTLRLAATGANDSLLNHDGVAALLLAESGLERAAGQLGANIATCDNSLAGSWGYAGGNIVIADLGAGFSTDFDGSALASGRCRVRATGSTGLFSAQRTVEAIISRDAGNLLGQYADFNATTCIFVFFCYPTGWWIDPFFSGWSNTGGVDNTRAAVVNKTGTGAAQTTTAEMTGLAPFTVTAPSTLTVDFDYRITAPTNQGVQVEFELAVGGSYNYSGTSNYTGTTSGFVSDSITIAITGSGPVTIDGFRVTLTASGGQPKSMWLDNLVMAGPGGGAAGVERWREVVN